MICRACRRENPAGAKFCNECGAGLDTPAETVEPASPQADPSSFVGRQREMAELLACLDDAQAGQGRLVMLAGEPGIGKTRTAEELEHYARERGFQVYWGRCYEGEGAPPYWPWIQPLRDYIQQHSPEHLLEHMGNGASDIAEILPELRNKVPTLQPSPSLEPEQARFRLFDSITGFLKSGALYQPLALVLDDLHWADHSSLLLLEFLVREISRSPLLLVGTYRDMELSRQHPLTETLGELTRQRLSRRVLLRGLNEGDVTRLVERASDLAISSEFIQAVYTQTEGNPLFVTEVARLLAQEGERTGPTMTEESWTGRIPEGVREVIGRRLNRLSAPCNEILTIASVIGREFELRQLEPLVEELSEDKLLEVLEEALSARIIEELPEMMGRYQFTHALIQETLAGELTLTRKVRLHAQIAAALEELYANEAESHASELAYHFAQAEMAIGAEKLVHYAGLAGQRSLDSYAFEEALAHFERALAAKQGQQIMDDEYAELLFGLARTQAATREDEEKQAAIDNVIRAFDHYVEAGEVPRAIEIASCFLVSPASRPQGVTRMLERALSLVPPDASEAGRLLSFYGYFVGIAEGNYEDALASLNRALVIAQRDGDKDLEMTTLSVLGAVNGRHLRFEESLQYCLRSLELSQFSNEPFFESGARAWASRALMAIGDIAGAEEHLSAALRTAERLRHKGNLSIALRETSELFYGKGDWQAARQFNEDCLAIMPDDLRAEIQSILLAYETGDFGVAGSQLTKLLERVPMAQVGHPDYLALIIAKIGWITGGTYRFPSVRVIADQILSSSYPPHQSIGARIALALMEVVSRNRVAASELYDSLAPWRGIMHSVLYIDIDRILGLLAATMADGDRAAGHFDDAISFCSKAGYRPELAWTCCDYAEMLIQGNQAGDRNKAKALLDESLDISTELGMRPLMERVRSRLKHLGAGSSAIAEFPADLTQREVEVLRLMASGKTNREISEELFISTKTVSYHLGNIFNKTDSSNRAEAASFATRHGLA